MKYLGGVGVKVAVIGLGTSAADVMLPEGTTELLACCRRSLLPALRLMARERGISIENGSNWMQADYVVVLWDGYDGDVAMKIKQCLSLGIPHQMLMI